MKLIQWMKISESTELDNDVLLTCVGIDLLLVIDVSSSTVSLWFWVNGAMHSPEASHLEVFSLNFLAKPPEVDKSAMMLPSKFNLSQVLII